MDVGNPSNFPRLLALYDFDENLLKKNVSGAFYSDSETVEAIKKVKRTGYTMDPHGAVGYLGLMDFMKDNPGYQGVFLETAHPGKFRDVVETALGEKLVLPERLASFMEGEKKVSPLKNDFEDFKCFLNKLPQ
jgi:threonine synthase